MNTRKKHDIPPSAEEAVREIIEELSSAHVFVAGKMHTAQEADVLADEANG